MSDEQFDKGLAMRKQVMGEDFVARAYAGVTDFTAPLQHHITRNAWGEVWQRPGLDLKTRSLVTVAMLAVPLGIKVAYEGLSWGRTVNEFTTAWDVVCRADCPNLGIGIDSFHIFAANTALDDIEELDPEKIFLVQLSDFMWQETPTFEERMTTARTFRVFPGEGVHSEQLAQLVMRLDRIGYRGDYSFEVFNDDYQQLPLDVVAERARRSAMWLHQDVLHRTAPLPSWTRQS